MCTPFVSSALMSTSSGDERVVIAILDGPVETDHACLASANLETVSLSEPLRDLPVGALRHGTHVTSQVFANGECGFTGIAPKCRGLLIPVYPGTRKGELIAASQIDLARAIRLAVDRGAHIINISGGELSPTPEADQFLLDAITYCEENGVIVVGAAGNNGCECLHVPASIPTVLAVGAMDPKTREPLGFSNWGDAYRSNAILAPGKDIPGAKAGGGLDTKSGTSFAAPIVTGVAALMMSLQLQRGQDIDPLAVRRAILKGATPCNPSVTGDCSRYLAGTLNVDASLALMSDEAEPPCQAVEPSVATGMEIETTCACQTFQRPNLSGNAAVPTDSGHVDGAAILPDGATPSASQQAIFVGSRLVHQTSAGSPKNRLAPLPNFSFEGAAVVPSSTHSMKTNKSRREDNMSDQEGNMKAESIETQAAFQEMSAEQSAQSGGIVTSEASSPPPPATLQPTPPAAVAANGGIEPSDCGCGCDGGAVQKVFALGKLRYDLVTEARKDSLWQAMHKNPYEWKNMLDHLKKNPWDAEDVTWTLEIDATPIYAIKPIGAHAASAYERLLDFLKGQIDEKIERISVPGVIGGSTTLTNGITVPVVIPTMRGMFSWNTDELLEAATTPETKSKVENFLNRIYYELRSLGQSPQERALNFAATNAFQAEKVFNRSAEEGHELDDIAVERSPVCRQDSDCWDVILTTFDPLNDRGARMRHRFTVDVSDVVPCTVGAVRSWSVR
ncbi:PatA/PatG family cyanobactin maturation protease [Pseudophaeobacter sp.]|uniref:PatA/PatG family cyanobactin maturation protease n=1 Tax=Pseudophaeobacter sp. TaxID=1971739 RepID=UPI003296A768